MNKNSTTQIFKLLRTGSHEDFIRLATGNVNATSDSNRSLLHEAIAYGKKDSALTLIKLGAELNAKDILGRTPLHYAAMFNQLETVNALINAGSDANEVDKYGNNPLWTAVLTPNINREIIRALMLARSDCYSINKSGSSAIDMAVAIGDKDILSIMEGGQ